MLVVKEEDGAIVELFDTAVEFKHYLANSLFKISQDLKEEELWEKTRDATFGYQYETWHNYTGRRFEIA